MSSYTGANRIFLLLRIRASPSAIPRLITMESRARTNVFLMAMINSSS
ncbi:hypothetical protein ES703_55714 [subsurface metagenome]